MTAADKHAEYQIALIASDTARMNTLWAEYLALVEIEMRAKKLARENADCELMHKAG